jgi:cytoskeletal protein CcmA (bactofilin family)
MWEQTGPKTTRDNVTGISATTDDDELTTMLRSADVLRPALGADATVTGRLSFTRPTRLDGTLRGEVRSTALLVIGETGVVDGTVRATKLLILGRVLGTVLEAARVEIAAGGELRGDVEARSFVIQEGGRFDGNCRISPPTRATVHVLHPDRQSESDSTPVPDAGSTPHGTG